MTISDDEFIWFYQGCIMDLLIGGDYSMPSVGGLHASYRIGCTEKEWYEKAMAFLTRMGISGVIHFWHTRDDIRIVLKELFLDRSRMTWDGYYFELTEYGEKLAKKFRFDEEEDVETRVFPDYREELERILNEHGVGFDVDLPYDKLLSLDGE